MNGLAAEIMPNPHGVVVIGSNLAIPTIPNGAHTLENPHWVDASVEDRQNFTRPKAFHVPSRIELKLYNRSREPHQDELLETMRRLGHGVTALIERDECTFVDLIIPSGNSYKADRRYVRWTITGVATVLGKRVGLQAFRVAGHAAHPELTGSRVRLSSLQHGRLLQ